jgi:ribosomal protein S12 methylthiotransferase
LKTKTHNKDNISIVTLGCSKNLVDSENIYTQLKANNLEVEHESASPDIVIVNTCGFIERAKEESIQTILNYAELKKSNDIQKLYVTGCLSHRYKEEMEEEIPEVDAFFGTMELPGLLERFNVNYRQELLGERSVFTPSHYAYLKISEGCNRTCSFCAIPLMRGKHVSRSIEDLVTEAKNLAKSGTRELILIAQELTYYGLDIYKKRSLGDLLNALCEVEGIDWIRLHYAYPTKFPLDVIDVMSSQPKVCNYLDIPLQHASDTVLERMRRHITQEEMRVLMDAIKQRIPGITIRTTMLVGFPGETEEEFESLCSFIKEMKFDRLGVFEYSHEDGTSAFELEDDVSPELKTTRANKLMDIQREISLIKNEEKMDQTYKVLIDRKEGSSYYGRTESDSPEVDNEVIIDAVKFYARVGDFVNVQVNDTTEYDIYGEIV